MSLRAFLLQITWVIFLPMNAHADVELIDLQSHKLEYKIQRNGVLDFKHLTNLSFRTSGFLQRLEVEEGDMLELGQEIARLDDTDLQANLYSAQASYRKASGDLKRAKELFKKKTVSEDFLELAIRDERNSKTNLELAKYDIESAVIVAPFSAAVVDRLVQPGELLPAGNPAYQVAALDDNYVVKLELTQDERRLVSLGDKAQVFFDVAKANNGQSVAAQITKITARADPVSGMFFIELTIEQAVPVGFAGQWVNVSINGRSEEEVFAVPFAAISKMKDLNVTMVEFRENSYQIIETRPLYIDQEFFYVTAASKSISLVSNGWHLLDLQH
ncbi:efflux RND transporter periplasmic adaptor subunit [Alginatibacterium sediminis]|nr:efflux RND transporter periplasmic adaptor subunit [Alginatibacterium sediminis]